MSLNPTPIVTIKNLVDLLAANGITPLHLLIDTKHGTATDRRPDVSLWTQTRTDFERLCTVLAIKPVERRYSMPGQRSWYAEKDTDARRLLVQCVSFEHHDDWQPRDRGEAS